MPASHGAKLNSPTAKPPAGVGVRRLPLAVVVLSLAALLVLALGVAAAFGQVSIPLATLYKVCLNALGITRFPADWARGTEEIVLTFRMPRVVAAACVGAALATSGALLQGLLRNPLADPYVVGTSGGAALGAVIGMILGNRISVLGFGIVPLLAFGGALLALTVVVSLSSVGGRLPIVSVLLTGFVLSTMLGYTGSLLLVLENRMQMQLPRVYGWVLGGVSVIGWQPVAVVLPLTVGGVLAAMGMSRSLNAFSLGEDGAARLGVDVERSKRWVLVLASLLTGTAVSVAGLIGFVGLIIPHLVRMVCGPDYRLLVPASALLGSTFLVLADLAARMALYPSGELPVGIVTAFVGGPFFLVLLRRSRREYQW